MGHPANIIDVLYDTYYILHMIYHEWPVYYMKRNEDRYPFTRHHHKSFCKPPKYIIYIYTKEILY